MRILAPLTAALVPLIITPGILYYFDITPKLIVLLLAVSLALVWARENSHNVFTFLRSKAGRCFAVLLLVQLILLAVGAVFSAEPWLAINGSAWRRFGLIGQAAVLVFALLTAAWLSQDRSNVRSLLRAIAFAGGIAAAYGIAQYFGLDPLLPVKAYQTGEEGPFMIVRPPGTLGNANYFGPWLLVAVFSCAALVRIETGLWLRWAAIAIAGLGSVAIVLSGTRAAWLGLAVGGLIILIARHQSWRLALAVIVAIAVILVTPAGLRLRARLHWSMEDPRGGARLLLWRDSLRMSVARPVIGFGPEAFVTEFPRFESVDLARAYPDFYHESPHNIFLDALVSGGPLAALDLMAIAALGLYLSWRAGEFALFAGLSAVLVCQQFSVFILPTSLAFYMLVGMCVAVAHGSSLAGASRGLRRSWYYAAVPIALLFTVFAIRVLVADRELQIAYDRIASRDPVRAAQAYTAALRWQPAGASADLDYSRRMQSLGTSSPVAARQALESAARGAGSAEDRQNAWYHLATLLAAQNDPVGVERALRNAIAWAPNWFKPHWALARLLEATGRHQEAFQQALLAVETDGGKNPEVSQFFYKLGIAR